jgi:chloride channel protein, CIC family
MKLRRQQLLLLDTVLLGVVGALSARVFEALLALFRHLFLDRVAGYHLLSHTADWRIAISTTLGGLLSGLLVYTFAPEAEGHGTDTAVKAFHRMAGIIRARVPVIKVLASAITIGSGGSAGREGPTALTAAGVGSIYAQWTRRSEQDRRLLLVAGMAAGLSAIFRSPVGSAFFAVEVLYGEMEFESGALPYTLLASIVAYCVNGWFAGFGPLFNVPSDLPATTPAGYGWYAVLGLGSGLVAVVLPATLYGVRDAFRRIPCRPHFKPAIGGLLVGLVAMVLPQVLGGGYEWIQQAIDGHLGLRLMVLLAFAKMVTFALTIGSGGSGGVFAPSLYVGAMFGGMMSHFFHQPAVSFAVVGMAAVFGAAARVPIATILMVTEMTNGYGLLVGAALAVILSSLVQSFVTDHFHLRYASLYEAQVPTRAHSPAHYRDQLRSALDLLRTRDAWKVPDIEGLELISLVEAGIPVRLPDGREIHQGVLRHESDYVGQPLKSVVLGPEGQVELILVLRQSHTLWPRPGMRLEEGDHLVAISSTADWEAFRPNVDSLPEANAGA